MITVKNLFKQFDSRGIAGLHRLSFTLKEGEVMGLMGPNGSGKSTLLNILSGKIPAQDGEFKVEGSVKLFPSITADEDIHVQKFLISCVTLEIDEEKKVQLARDLADTFEFTFQLRQKIGELSSGQRQKVMLAAELINRPALLLMDEPFTHLDPFTRRDILNGLFQYIRHQKITVLWVTHELEEAFKYSDIVGLMNFGKLEQLNTPHTLMTSPRNLFVAQFVGYQNFLPVKKVDGLWMTPWGNLKKDFPHDEAILVIPDEAWKLDVAGTEAKVISRFTTRQGTEYKLLEGERSYTLKLSPLKALLELNSKVGLLPDFKDCFLIPL